jgi:hypothetical protein
MHISSPRTPIHGIPTRNTASTAPHAQRPPFTTCMAPHHHVLHYRIRRISWYTGSKTQPPRSRCAQSPMHIQVPFPSPVFPALSLLVRYDYAYLPVVHLVPTNKSSTRVKLCFSTKYLDGDVISQDSIAQQIDRSHVRNMCSPAGGTANRERKKKRTQATAR